MLKYSSDFNTEGTSDQYHTDIANDVWYKKSFLLKKEQ